MNTKDAYEKTITENLLKEKLLIKSDRTIESYVMNGSLPEPVQENENSDLLFDKETVLKMLGIKSLEEEFINTEAVAKMLNVNISTVQSFARKGLIPCYRLKNVKGSQILYLPSEIEAAKQYTIQWQVSFGNNLIIKAAIKTIFSKLLGEKTGLFTQRETDVLKMVLLEDKKPEEIAEKFSLTSERIKHIFQQGIKRLYRKLDELTYASNKLPEMQNELVTLSNKLNHLGAELNQYVEAKKEIASLPE
jgi:DNA-binding transcriptional MerR regulator